jgi:molybdopterin adenylyltransferase
MNDAVSTNRAAKIGLVSISDRASQGVYQDMGLPGLRSWLESAIRSDWQAIERLIPDEKDLISKTLVELVDQAACDLIFTTGGTGPAARDVTPEATLAIADKELPGFGEQMRQISLHYVPTAILSRQVGVIRAKSMIVNLPGQPKAIAETLGGVRNDQGETLVHGIFAAIPYGLELIGGPSIFTHEAVCKAFRPKKK